MRRKFTVRAGKFTHRLNRVSDGWHVATWANGIRRRETWTGARALTEALRVAAEHRDAINAEDADDGKRAEPSASPEAVEADATPRGA